MMPAFKYLVPVLCLLALTATPLHADTDGGFLAGLNQTQSHQGQVVSLSPPRAGEYFEFIPLQSVRFAHDADELDERARLILDDVAMLIRHLPGVTRVIVKGHTDSIGGEDYNDTLSDRRAETVHDYLIERGISLHLLQAIGYGYHVPIDEEWTREGRARNRRVEIYIVRVQDGN